MEVLKEKDKEKDKDEELTREEECEKDFLDSNLRIQEKNQSELYKIDSTSNFMDFILEYLARLTKLSIEKQQFDDRYSDYKKDLEVIKEQEAITKSIIKQLSKTGVAQVKISYSDKKNNNIDKIYDFSYDEKTKLISLAVTTLTKEQGKEKPKEKIEKFDFPFKKYYLEKEDKDKSSEKNSKEVPKQEPSKEEKTEPQNTQSQDKQQEAKEGAKENATTNAWAEKANSDKDNIWNKENMTAGIDKDNPFAEKFENDKRSSLDIGLGIELE